MVLAAAPDRVPEVRARAAASGVRVADLGVAGGDRLVARGAFDVALADALAAWHRAIPSRVDADVHV